MSKKIINLLEGYISKESCYDVWRNNGGCKDRHKISNRLRRFLKISSKTHLPPGGVIPICFSLVP
jgi:hypothetical protein